MVLLAWMYISEFLSLVGSEVNAAIEHVAQGGKERGEKRRDG